ncbi:4-coumarate-CoA ligase 2 [Mytilinidion resinicola]|uniref:4-coumarate-CoA ligase 2 n=1 Tax=Mytilinidion resinicola TaxID=574789 RepID=A0A6A6YGR2_9PEZI|nr:4-coumarate-CoA ligase 2 [Mytilinidion resinicola]KAF2807768.1 4-coumarate-CoA ligase 2 [Mytilinidion resinicola]
MTIFKSHQPPIDIPSSLTAWDWLFDSPYSPLSPSSSASSGPLGGYTNAATGARVDYAQVRTLSTHLATALVKHHGLQPGETISLFSQNIIWYPIAMFGGLRAGAVISGASPAYGVEEMAYALTCAKARFLMTMKDSLHVAVEAAERVGLGKDRVFLLEGKSQGFKTVQDLVEEGKMEVVESWKIPPGKRNGDVCGYLSFSSGTTGLPKAQITPVTHHKIMAVLPLFHITGLVHQLHLPVLLNAEVIMLPQFTMPEMLKIIVDYQLTELLLVPPIIIRLVRDKEVNDYDLSHVTRFSSGAAPLSEEIIQLLKKKFPGTGFKQGYGMTESCSCITAHPPEKYDYKYAHTGGAVVANTEVKIIKEDGTEAGVGEAGEIPARGPQVVMGYLGNEKATQETFVDGWLRTGDQGAMNEEGMIHILDRIKEMIKVKGIGVAPAELEDLLLGHPQVEDVAVMGIKDDYSGELPKAFVVLKDGVNASEEVGRALMKWVRERKTRYKWIKEVEFVNEIPKSASGKILRRMLRDRKAVENGVKVRDAVGEKAML